MKRENILYLYIVLFLSFNNSICFAQTIPSKNGEINKIFYSMCSNEQFSGNILIANYDKIIFKKSCGYANRNFNVKNNLQTKFNLGSIGKIFTSISIAQLIEKNKLSLDEEIYKIIPSWLPNEADKKITVEQLLTHAAGLGNFMDDKRWKLGADSALYITVNDYKPLILDDKRLFKPGESQRYSNNGYIVLGTIIESLSNEDYFDYVKKNIFNVAQMNNTGLWRLDVPIFNRAEGYFSVCSSRKCQWKNNNFEAPFIGSPAGGAYSTVDDMYSFTKALHSKKLLNSNLTSKIFSTEVVSTNEKLKLTPYKIGEMTIQENFSRYGFAGAWNQFGFAVWSNPLLIGHTGGTKGASAFFATTPDEKYTIIILSNIDGSGPIQLYKNIRKTLGFSNEITNY